MVKTTGERLERLEGEIENLKGDIQDLIDAKKTRANREWTIIATGVGLVGTILGKALNLI